MASKRILVIVAGGAFLFWLLSRSETEAGVQRRTTRQQVIPPDPGFFESVGTALEAAGVTAAVGGVTTLVKTGVQSLIGADTVSQSGLPNPADLAFDTPQETLTPVDPTNLAGTPVKAIPKAAELLVSPLTFDPSLFTFTETITLPSGISVESIGIAPNLPSPAPPPALPIEEAARLTEAVSEGVQAPTGGVSVTDIGAGVLVGAGVGFGLSQIPALEDTPAPAIGGGVAGGTTTAALAGSSLTAGAALGGALAGGGAIITGLINSLSTPSKFTVARRGSRDLGASFATETNLAANIASDLASATSGEDVMAHLESLARFIPQPLVDAMGASGFGPDPLSFMNGMGVAPLYVSAGNRFGLGLTFNGPIDWPSNLFVNLMFQRIRGEVPDWREALTERIIDANAFIASTPPENTQGFDPNDAMRALVPSAPPRPASLSAVAPEPPKFINILGQRVPIIGGRAIPSGIGNVVDIRRGNIISGNPRCC